MSPVQLIDALRAWRAAIEADPSHQAQTYGEKSCEVDTAIKLWTGGPGIPVKCSPALVPFNANFSPSTPFPTGCSPTHQNAKLQRLLGHGGA